MAALPWTCQTIQAGFQLPDPGLVQMPSLVAMEFYHSGGIM